MKQRWNFRCYPTAKQEQILARTFGCTRFVYNRFLDERTRAFQRGERMNYSQTSAALSQLKKHPDCGWLNEVSSVPTQQALRHLQTAFRNCFDKRAGYPSFKRKQGKQSAEYTRSAFNFEIGNQRLVVAQLGRLKVKLSKPVSVQPTTVTIIRKPSGRYFVSMVVDVTPAPLPDTGESVGVDLGISRLATLSNGEHIANPRYTYKYQQRLRRQQKKWARKKKGSNRYARQRQKVARVHEKISDSCQDHGKKRAWDLVCRYDTVCVEDLNIRGAVKHHNLARAVSDAGIGRVIRTIETKALMHGRSVIKIDRWFPSSKMCSECGALQESMALSVRQWTCDCGAHHDRDENAAINIGTVGQTGSNGRGDDVRAA